ncbi:MAG: 2-amino-4-hydroxy-6-hydroxymethyldihydropteridine diphosphokinase [Planctomycetota bacterium]|nr:2-amino-4-hydroxy-6-hydroxymethyldihydropteridine diphosphokinase [Planctomycetota bacterium]MDE1888712.1 2-amino-4-hydroxy-6-hydroxymethyldihydropteridine diphosphokinase [Planctomycetota bacterium]MDE2216201.1 2-amino-4-hydroxy-6-hydroxymethyldihydropteridine diphosphokinase [Planctomycetota bacterium]
MACVCIGLGSNVGDRARNLVYAYDRIITLRGIQLLKLSRFYETTPVGGPPQPMFLNAALSIETTWTPHQLLKEFQHIERFMGRVRAVKWGPRNIDIDILLYGDKIVNEDQLKIPHPLMHTRLFVLEPLIEIEPNIVHPLFNKTVLHLYKNLKLH